ncbi:MAG TPA: amidohydrolase family protein [Acidimicrobiales bacterium]|nr:amidohydrolase family protein [Acidimicrobiales bacterium]
MDRYTVISADCHAGAPLRDYKEFLESRYRDEFEEWAAGFVNPFADLERPEADRSWNSERRRKELEEDGIAGEVIYPNTIPPFFPKGGLTALCPGPDEFEQRLAGLRAHNRWLAAFCAELPERRAGIGQILLNDVEEAVRDVHWIADNGLRGGILLPGMPPDAPIPPLHAPVYDPVWRACEERGVVVNAHGGSASPDYGDWPASQLLWLMETTWFSHRPLWSLILGGVFDRFPGLRLVLAEQGSAWVRSALDAMDQHYRSMAGGGVGELRSVGQHRLERMPSEYWQTNCYVAASFMHPADCARRDLIGSDRIMWGSDYPHLEGTYPFSKEGISLTFADVRPDEAQVLLGSTAAAVYGFDLDALAPLAARFGPRVEEVAAGLEAVPEGATSLAFRERPPLNV